MDNQWRMEKSKISRSLVTHHDRFYVFVIILTYPDSGQTPPVPGTKRVKGKEINNDKIDMMR